MKGFTLPAIMWLFISLGIIFIAGTGLIGHAFIASLTGAEMSGGCEVKTGLKLVPLIGYYSCEPQGNQMISMFNVPDSSWWNPAEKWVTCCNYNVQACTFQRISNVYGGTIGSGITANRGECIEMTKDGDWLISPSSDSRIEIYGDPFALVRYSPISSPEKVNSENCRLPSTSNLLTKVVSYAGTGSLQTVINPTDSLDFNQKSSFLADWAVSPTEYNYVNGKYCASGGYLYTTQTVSLVSGCYVAPDMNVQPQKVLGCPGEPCSTGGRAGIIDGNYNCIMKEGSQCSILSPCPGQGRYNVDWNKDSSGKTAVIYSCANGYCEASWKTSECSSNSACPVGSQCQFDASTGIGACKTVGSTPIQPQPGVPSQEGFDIGLFIKNMFTAMFVSAIILFGILIAGRFFLPLRLFSRLFSTPKMFLIVWIALSVLLIVVFAIPIGNLAASMFGGI